ncbi:MAG TPA: hypothetical protein VG457_09285, partial [Planctomycetota bacterium]|nr:hypothetical protein [Planctomycetota bacterium]
MTETMMKGLLLLLLTFQGQDPRTPVPDLAAQKEKERLIHDVFKEEYGKKTVQDRVGLAAKLLQQGTQTNDDPVARYVLLREARDISAAAGDVATAMTAIGLLARTFEVDPLRMKLGVLTTISQDAKLAESAKIAAESLLRLVDEAVDLDDLETQEKAVGVAVATAKRAKDAPLVARAEAKSRELQDLKQKQVRVKSAREALAANPADPAASLELGQFECFTKGNWSVGLPLLAKGSNEALRVLALKDLSNPDQMPDQLALADAWKERADKEPGAKQKLRERAVFWYEKARPAASGILKVKVEKA